MSEQIPESVPTSADPRSKRPLKKRALSPRSQTASQITALFSKPDQEIRIPSNNSSSLGPHNPNVPEIVQNVQGSSAGAGSGEFHVYKASRRREYERLRQMEEDVKGEEEGEKWEREKKEREERDREATRKKREKRERLKRKKGGKKGDEEGEDPNGIADIFSRPIEEEDSTSERPGKKPEDKGAILDEEEVEMILGKVAGPGLRDQVQLDLVSRSGRRRKDLVDR